MPLVRVLGTGQVEDFIPSVAFALVSCGRGEYLKSPEKVETAAVIPQKETATKSVVPFKRGPISQRKS